MKIVKDIATIHQERDGFCEASSGSDNNSKTGFCQRISKIDGFGENVNLELSKPVSFTLSLGRTIYGLVFKRVLGCVLNMQQDSHVYPNMLIRS